MQHVQSQNIYIKSCFIHFIPLVSFCTPWKHQKTSAFLIYRVFTGMGLSTVGYLRDLCSRLLVKRGVRFTSENYCYKRLFFFLQTSASVFVQCAAKEPKDGIGMIEVVIFQFSLYVQGTYFYKPKKQQSFKAKKISFDKNLDTH